MITDLAIAATITLAGGLAFFQDRRLPNTLALLGVAVSIAAGPLILWRRGRQPLIPIASIYCVVMFFVLVLLDFVIAAYRGQVDL